MPEALSHPGLKVICNRCDLFRPRAGGTLGAVGKSGRTRRGSAVPALRRRATVRAWATARPRWSRDRLAFAHPLQYLLLGTTLAEGLRKGGAAADAALIDREVQTVYRAARIERLARAAQ